MEEKMSRKLISLMALSLSFSAFAADDSCKLYQTKASSSTALKKAPSYFISPDPTGNYVGVITSSGNTIVDLKSGDYVNFPDRYDPVFTPDGKYITTPGGIFYKAGEARTKVDNKESAKELKPIHRTGMEGVYQSLGTVKNEGGKSTYRMIDDTDGVSWQEYTIDHSSSGVKQKMGKSKKLCPGIETDTPMLSKDGKYLSVYNKDTGTTQIYNIEDNVNSGKPCHKVLDLGFPTGKVSFDYKNGQIAFHVDSVETQTNYFSGVSSRSRKDSFVLKIDKGKGPDGKEKWTPTSFTKMNLTDGKADLGTGTYYPRFRKDGSILTVVQHKSGLAGYSLDVVNQGDIAWQPFKAYLFDSGLYSTCNDDQRKEIRSLYALGELWSQICGNYNDAMRFQDTLKIPFGMDHDQCVKLINDKWKDNMKAKVKSAGYREMRTRQTKARILKMDEIDKLSTEDLIAVCPPKFQVSSSGRPEMVGMFGERKPKTGPEILEVKCAGCHESAREDRPYIDFSNPSKADINSWAQHTFNKSLPKNQQMPPSDENQLEPEEAKVLKEYFIKVLSGQVQYQRAIPE